jgi:hypothetical protein
VGGTQDIARLLEGVFDLAGGEKCSGCSILYSHESVLGLNRRSSPTYHKRILVVSMNEAELVIVNAGGIEGAHWSDRD